MRTNTPYRLLLSSLVLILVLLLSGCGGTQPAPAQPEVVVVTPTPEPVEQAPEVMVVTATGEPAAEAPAVEEPAAEEPAAEEPAAEEPAAEEPAAAPSDVATVAHNGEWTPKIEEFDGIEYALVPPGCFDMGSEDTMAKFNEQPVHQQCFDQPYWIAIYETSNEDVEQRGFDIAVDRNWRGDDVPRTNITWPEAQAFCQSIGARLPTEVEWEYAARGPDGWIWSFGDTWLPGFVVQIDNAISPAEVGSLPENASWVGAYDMPGNVREWTTTLFDDYPYEDDDGREGSGAAGKKVVRGGSYQAGRDSVRGAYREWYEARGYTADIGFRCARDY